MRTETVRVGRDAPQVINPLTEALVLDRRQRLLDEAAGPRRTRPVRAPGPARRAVGTALIRVGTRLSRPRPVLLSAGR
jgi:hypothetical protein